jgi:SAM-dependent methyltransferase
MSVLGEALASAWHWMGAWPYDLIYRRGAPWEGQPRQELAELLRSGHLSVEAAGGTRALDVGCGSGADSILLADHGFDVLGLDFSAVALDKARAAAGDRAGVRFVQADLFALPDDVTESQYDLIFDGGTLDDFPAARRRELARTLTRLARPGAVLVLWCFSADPADLPLVSLRGPSRIGGVGIPEAEMAANFSGGWEIERLDRPRPGRMSAFYWMRRHSGSSMPSVVDPAGSR